MLNIKVIGVSNDKALGFTNTIMQYLVCYYHKKGNILTTDIILLILTIDIILLILTIAR